MLLFEYLSEIACFSLLSSSISSSRIVLTVGMLFSTNKVFGAMVVGLDVIAICFVDGLSVVDVVWDFAVAFVVVVVEEDAEGAALGMQTTAAERLYC